MKRPAVRSTKEASLTEKRAEIRSLIDQIGWGTSGTLSPAERRALREVPDNVIPFPVQYIVRDPRSS
jgi:hypothetical protein